MDGEKLNVRETGEADEGDDHVEDGLNEAGGGRGAGEEGDMAAEAHEWLEDCVEAGDALTAVHGEAAGSLN